MSENFPTFKCQYCEIHMNDIKELAEHYIEAHPDSREASRARFAKLRKGKEVRKRKTNRERVMNVERRYE